MMSNKYNTPQVHLPHLDKIKREIRDKIYASESEIKDFLTDISNEINLSLNQIKFKNNEVLEKKENLNEEIEYYDTRKNEIKNQDISILNQNVRLKGDAYLKRAENYRDLIKEDFKNVVSLFNYDSVILSRLKNKIELHKSKNDDQKSTYDLGKNETADSSQQYSRLNLDNYSNTKFYNQVYIPFDNQNEEALICSVKVLPANYRDNTLTNYEIGAFSIKLSLRSQNLAYDLHLFSTKINDKKYGCAIVSEGGINNGEDLNLKVYYNKIDATIYLTIKNIYQTTVEESEISSGNFVVNIGVNIILGGNYYPPMNLFTPFDNSNENLLSIGEALLPNNENIYGPINTGYFDNEYYNRSMQKIFLSQHDIFGETNIYRINTIESDNENLTDDNKKLSPSIQYSSIDGSKTYKDEIGEVLIRTLQKLGLKENIVYTCFGYVIIDQMFFPIEQLKLTSKIREVDETNLISDELMCGLEMAFDRNWILEKLSFNDINGNEIVNFPGISIEGSKTFKNYDTKTEFDNDTPIRQASYGSPNHAIYNNEAIKLNIFKNDIYNNFSWWEGKNAKIILNGYDITILSSTKLLNNTTPELLNIKIK